MREHADNMPTGWLLAACAIAGLVALGYLTGFGRFSILAAMTGLTEGGMAVVIVVAGAGLAYPIVRRLGGPRADTAVCVITAAALGLWLISSAVLVIGSLTTGLLKAWLWWPLVAVGVLLAAWQGRRRMETLHFAGGFDGRAMTWVLLALAGGVWLAGATQPPGYISLFGDSYDVLEYHLQVPREYYINQHIAPLPHNVYSHYPLGVETLFLLGMVLRGGAYEGMYLAKLMHGVFGGLAVAGVFAGLRRDQDARARFAAILLGTAPMALYLGWLAMTELAQLCYLALALVWLRGWLTDRRLGWAAIIGGLLGASCATKYLAVGLVAGPVLAVMLAWCVMRPRLLGHWLLAVLMTGLLFSPWLIRNVASVGNPVFPLATQWLGHGGFSVEHEQRWLAGHGPTVQPPAPPPPGYAGPPDQPNRLKLLFDNLIANDLLGPVAMMLAGVGLAIYLAAPSLAGGWNWSVLAVLAAQLGVWTFATHGMPSRFIAPAMVPLALLGADALARLSSVRANPFSRGPKKDAGAPWGRPVAVAVLAATLIVNIAVAVVAHARAVLGDHLNGAPGGQLAQRDMAEAGLREGDRLMLVGEARAFYSPPGTIYATDFDKHPLVELARSTEPPHEVLRRLHELGVTHVWVDWFEILRLATTYGFDEPLGSEVVRRRQEGLPPSLQVLAQLEPHGLRLVGEIRLDQTPPADTQPTTTQPAAQPATTRPATTQPATTRPPAMPSAQTWPIVSIYALPWASTQPATTQP